MGWVDNVPGTKIYIGGLHALYQKQDMFREAKITHIVSVLDFDIYEAGHFEQYKHFHLRLDDDPNENILQHFADTNQFIDKAIQDGGAVFVHCAMGKSRSATIVCAYLMWRHGMSPEEALARLNEGRPVCDPNPGFWEQLEVYDHMLKAKDDAAKTRAYQDWHEGRGTTDWYTVDRRRQATKL